MRQHDIEKGKVYVNVRGDKRLVRSLTGYQPRLVSYLKLTPDYKPIDAYLMTLKSFSQWAVAEDIVGSAVFRSNH